MSRVRVWPRWAAASVTFAMIGLTALLMHHALGGIGWVAVLSTIPAAVAAIVAARRAWREWLRERAEGGAA